MKQFKAMLSILLFLLFICSFPGMVSAKSPRERIKNSIEEIAEVLQENGGRFGNDFLALQNYLDNYQWRGIVQGEASSGVVTLADLRLNNHHRAIVVKPEQMIDVDVVCQLDTKRASALEVYRVLVGFKGLGPQASICNCFGISPGKKVESFHLKAPKEPGFYEVRFRTTNKVLESRAFHEWVDDRGNEPDSSTTIGIVWVKQ